MSLFLVLWPAMILALAYPGAPAIAAEPKPNAQEEFFEDRDEPTKQATVPEIVQKDVYQSACKFMESVYPDIDKDWMHKRCGDALMKDRYGLLELQYPRSARVRVRVKATIQMDLAFPWCDFIEMGANRPPPGVVPEVLAKPLTLEEAEVRARRTLTRVVGDAQIASRFKVTSSGQAQQDYDWFNLDQFAQSPAHYPLTHVYIDVRRSDGFIQRCNWDTVRLRPTFPYEKVAEMAKAAGRTGHSNDDIMLGMSFNGGIGTLVWEFCPPPEAGLGSVHTQWDAMTGELVYSQVLHGGTAEKPYENRKYCRQLDDEAIKRNIEKMIAERVEELRTKKAGEQGTGKAPSDK
jgi:hypothetical protein